MNDDQFRKREEMKRRTKEFAKTIVGLCRKLPRTREGSLIGGQLFRAGTSVGANYRAVCRARSRADFIAKLGIVLEEADESLYWLEIIQECQVLPHNVVAPMMKEADELVAIFVSSLNTAKNGSK
jgi:four helix bundle protein